MDIPHKCTAFNGYVLLFLVLSLLTNHQAWALSSGYDFLSMRLATDGGKYFSLWDTHHVRQKHFVIGNQFHYAHKSLQLTQSGARLRGIIDHAFLHEIYGSYGLVPRWLSIGVNIPMAWYLDYLDPNVAASSSDGKTALGDIRVNFKSQLVSIEDHHWGLALVPFMTIPTGAGDKFLGSKSITGGGLLAFEIEPFHQWSFATNVGIQAVPDFQLRNANKSLQLLVGLGSHIKFTSSLEGVAEMVTSGRLSGLYQEKVESPIEVRGGMKFHIPNTGFTASLGGGSGLIHGSGAPLFRVFTGLTFSSHRQKTAHRRKAIDFINTQAVLFFDVNKRVGGPETEKFIKTIARHVKKGELKEITIKGYADHTGTERDDLSRYNLSLSQKRAKKIKERLLLENLPDGFIMNTKGYGYRFYDHQKPDQRCSLNERCVLFEVVK